MSKRHRFTYDRDAAAHYARHRGVEPTVLERLIEGGSVGAGTRVLDVGCGTGDYIIALQETTGCAAWGVDISDEMLAYARKRHTAVAFAFGTADDLDFADASLDFVFSVDVIHHLGSPHAHFAEAHRMLAPGGSICTVTHSHEMLSSGAVLARYFPETIPANRARYPAIADLVAQMRAIGFDEIDEDEAAYEVEVADAALYAAKANSTLHLISDEEFRRGLARLEADLAEGPVRGTRRYLYLWGTK